MANAPNTDVPLLHNERQFRWLCLQIDSMHLGPYRPST